RGLAALPGLPYLALMNDDVLVEERTLADLVAALEAHPEAGAAGPLAYDGSGRLQDMGLPYRLVQGRALRAAGVAPASVDRGALDRAVGAAPARRPAAVRAPWLAGCLKVVARQAHVATGGYDEGFRCTNEDLDHGLRAARLGYTNLLVATPVTHLGGTSTPSHPAFHVEGRRGGYLVTERHLPGAARLAHRAYLVLEGSVGALLAPDPRARQAHRAVARMARQGGWGPGRPAASPGRAGGAPPPSGPCLTTARSGATFSAMPARLAPVVEALLADPVLLYTTGAAALLLVVSLSSGVGRRDFLALSR